MYVNLNNQKEARMMGGIRLNFQLSSYLGDAFWQVICLAESQILHL